MVLRTFFAQDSESLVISDDSPSGTPGDPIINNSDTPDGTIFEFSRGFGTTIILDDDDDFDVFNDDDRFDHVIIDGGGIVANGTTVESESIIEVRALDAGGAEIGPVIEIYVFSQNGITSDVWGFASSEALVPGTSYVKVGGSNFGDSPYTDYVPCFVHGTLILTEDGDQPVEDIVAGQNVWTRDAGLQTVRWIGHTKVEGTGGYAPVVFAPGSIGNAQELVLSQNHRVLVTASAAELLFGQTEVLVAAKHLCGLPGVSIREMEKVHYTHLMFDRHHLVRSNGTLTESFFVGHNAMGALTAPQRAEILSLFPELGQDVDGYGPTVAMTIGARDAAVLRGYL